MVQMCQYVMGTCDGYNVLIYTVDTWGYNKVLNVTGASTDIISIYHGASMDIISIHTTDTWDEYHGGILLRILPSSREGTAWMFPKQIC